MDADMPAGGQAFPDPDDVPAEATVLRMLLGAQLRRLREAASISAEKAGYEIRAFRSKISRMETGRVGFKVRDIELSGEALTPPDTLRFIEQAAKET